MEPNVIFIEIEKPTPFIVAQNSAGGEKDTIRLTIHNNLLIRLTYFVMFKDYSTGYIVDIKHIDTNTIDVTVISTTPFEKVPPVIIGQELIIIPAGFPPDL